MGSDCAEAEATKNTLLDGRWWVLSGDDVLSMSDSNHTVMIILVIVRHCRVVTGGASLLGRASAQKGSSFDFRHGPGCKQAEPVRLLTCPPAGSIGKAYGGRSADPCLAPCAARSQAHNTICPSRLGTHVSLMHDPLSRSSRLLGPLFLCLAVREVTSVVWGHTTRNRIPYPAAFHGSRDHTTLLPRGRAHMCDTCP